MYIIVIPSLLILGLEATAVPMDYAAPGNDVRLYAGA